MKKRTFISIVMIIAVAGMTAGLFQSCKPKQENKVLQLYLTAVIQ